MLTFPVTFFKSGAAAATYLLRTLFSGVSGQPVTLTDGQVLDTAAEGVLDGSLTVGKVGSSAYATIESTDKLRLRGHDGLITTGSNLVSQALTKADGLICIVKAMIPSGMTEAQIYSMVAGFCDNSVFDAYGELVCTWYFRPDNALSCFNGKTTALTLIERTWALNTEYEFAIVLDNTNSLVFFYMKDGTDWTLAFIMSVTLSTNLYAISRGHGNGASYPSTYMDLSDGGFVIPETLYPELVTPIVYDLFTDTEDTLLTAHTSDSSTSWEKVRDYESGDNDGESRIKSNKAIANITSGSGLMYKSYVTECNESDVGIVADLVTGSTISGITDTVGFILRSDGNQWDVDGDCVRTYINNTSDIIRVDEFTDGAGASRGSSACATAVNTTYPAFVSIVGSEVLFRVNGVSVTGTLVAAETHTKHGIDLSAINAVGSAVDNFKVYKASGVTIDV